MPVTNGVGKTPNAFAPLLNDLPYARMAYNGPRVYEPARRAQAVATLILCNRRDHRAGCRRPADDQREEASINPLLAAVPARSLLPAAPGTVRMALLPPMVLRP